jgi:signal peptidase I
MKDSVPSNDELATTGNLDSSSLTGVNQLRGRFKEWQNSHSFLSFVIEVVLLIVFIVIPFRALIAQPFQVYGDSMNPNFNNADYLIVNQLEQRLSQGPDRYEVVIFKYPGNNRDYYIKRVIGLPGERVEVKDTVTTVYSSDNPEGMVIENSYTTGETIGNTDITLGADEYFVMGDNRENSSDSRFWGALPAENIVGSPLIRLYPLNKLDLHPGKVSP